MKSELEKGNSWKPFVERAERTLQTGDFRVVTIRSLFRFIDPEFDQEPIGFVPYLRYLIYWNSSETGRRIRYLKAFEQFFARKKQMFKGAPQQVISLYNRLILKMFGSTAAASLLVPASWERKERTRVEKFIEYAEQSSRALINHAQDFLQMVPSDEEDQSEGVQEAEVVEQPEPIYSKPIVRSHPYTLFRDIPSDDQDALEARKRVYDLFQYRMHTFRNNIFELNREFQEVDTHELEQRLASLAINGNFFDEGVSQEEAKKRIQTLETTLSTLEAELQEVWKTSSFYILEQTSLLGEFSTRLALFLWPCMSDELAWQDLLPRLPSLKESMKPFLKDLIYNDKTKDRLETLFFDMTQLDDVRSLMGEIHHRAARQKDIIQSAMETMRKALSLGALAETIGSKEMAERLQGSIDTLIPWVRSFLTPRTSYASLTTREEVFSLFRNAWVAIEPLSADVLALEKKLEKEWSQEKAELFIRQMARFVAEVDRSEVFDKVLYTQFQTFSKKTVGEKSWRPFLEWNEQFGCGIHVMTLSLDERREGLRKMRLCREKVNELKVLQQEMLYAFYGDGSYVDFLVWSTRVLCDLAFLTHPSERVVIEPLVEKATAFVHLWQMSVPRPMFGPHAHGCPLSLEQVSRALHWTQSPKSRSLAQVVTFHRQIGELRQQGEGAGGSASTSIAQAVQYSALERRLWEDLFLHGFVIRDRFLKEKLVAAVGVGGESAERGEGGEGRGVEGRGVEGEAPYVSLPMVGDVGVLLDDIKESPLEIPIA